MNKSISNHEFAINPKITINRKAGSGTFKFFEIFKGFESLQVVRNTFGSETRSILKDLRVEVFDRKGYMGVSDKDGHIFASATYLNEGEEWSIYLDVVHELVHVKQFIVGEELFDPRYSYVDRPSEVAAYKLAVEEARRIGLSDEEILAYLEVPWISEKELSRLAKVCGINVNGPSIKK